MSRLQDVSRQRNWLKGRLAGIKNNLQNVDESLLHPAEREQLKQASGHIEVVLLSWDHHYEEIKKDLQDEDS